MARIDELKDRKQAVILIHGIGEQRPMATLRGFADAVLDPPPNPALPRYWSKPDSFSHSFELRRLSAPRQRDRPRTDFFEFYWQHMMQGNRLSHVWRWVVALLLRRPGQVPPQLRPLWWLSWLLLAAAVALLLWGGVGDWGWPQWLIAPVLLGQGLLLGYVGDAARYLTPTPANVARRQEIRSAGVDLLKQLHDSGKYNRIVVVAHSLGSVIGYDIVHHAWQHYHRKHDRPEHPPHRMLKRLEAAAVAGPDDRDPVLSSLRALQRDYGFELLDCGNPWLVTDLVTLGSPLTHAGMLIAGDADTFQRRLMERELPICPPVLEAAGFSYPEDYEITVAAESGVERRQRRTLRLPHHAACFAPVRWTNLYFPCRMIVFGDVIGGPLCDRTPPPARRFGAGVCDVAVTTHAWGGLLSHTRYWRAHAQDTGPDAPLARLREALALDDGPTWRARRRSAAPATVAAQPALATD